MRKMPMAAAEATHSTMIQIQKARFLSALTSIHKGVKKHASKDQTLLIALIGNDLVLSTPGLTVSETASGEWGGVGSVKLAHMLSFLTAEPEGDPVMIVRIDEAIRIGSARIPARWADLS